jgi:beta-lactam-binding protein with PASTA domain
MRSSVRNRVFALGATATAVLALSLAGPATADAAPAASNAQAVQAAASVVVPNVVGDNVGIGIDVLQAAGLGLGFEQFTDNLCDFAPFEVTDQTPAAGAVVAAGSVVTMTFAVRPKHPCP